MKHIAWISMIALNLHSGPVDLSIENPLFMQRSDGLYFNGPNRTQPMNAGRHHYNVTTPYGPGLLMATLPVQVDEMLPCNWLGGCDDPISICTKMPERTACVPYHNSEVYNSNCCSPAIFNQLNATQLEKWILIDSCSGKWNNDTHCDLKRNPAIIDANWTQYIQDLYFNVPFRAGRGVEAWLKFEQIQNGSLGFGFWNTVMDETMEMAWFLHQRAPDYPLNGLYIVMYQTGQIPVLKKLADLDENWHHYRVEWYASHMDFYLDHELVHRETRLLLSRPMALHVWHDDSIFVLSGNTVQHVTFPFNETKLTTMADLNYLDLPD